MTVNEFKKRIKPYKEILSRNNLRIAYETGCNIQMLHNYKNGNIKNDHNPNFDKVLNACQKINDENLLAAQKISLKAQNIESAAKSTQ